jgi:hypothetical protein
MLFYIRKALVGEIFKPCDLPPKIRDFVSDVQLRSAASITRHSRVVRTFTLITEETVRKTVLDGGRLADLQEFPGIIELDEGSSSHELYAQVAVYCDRPLSMILLWKVDDRRMPTAIIPEGPQKCPQKDMIIFVQELLEPVLNLPRGLRIAIITFFAQSATPKVQFIGTTTVTPLQPILQIFPFAWSILGIPNVLFNVYCEDYDITKPIPHNYPLTDLHLENGQLYLLEPIVPVQARYQFTYYKPRQEETVSYYSKIRPNGDMTALEYLERRSPQIRIEVYRVSDPQTLVITLTAPDVMPVTELPGLLLFATRDAFDMKRDTLQLFRQKLTEPVNEPTPYLLRADTTLRVMFVSDLKRSVDAPRLFYDILRGVSADQLKSMVIRTCEIYDAPCHKAKQIRWPMKITDPLQNLVQYIQTDVYPCKHARLLIDIEGLVHPVDFAAAVDENAILRFDVIPADQRTIRPGEFLVVVIVCRYTKNQDNATPLGQSFMFKVIPGEMVEATRPRIAAYDFADQRLVPYTVFQVGGRILNDDECLDAFARPNDTVKVVLPSGARSKSLLKSKAL